jgi:RHS repeat-associated protein
VDLPHDPDWEFTYDTSATENQKGRLASVTNGVVTTALEYDAAGQLVRESTTIDGKVYEVVSGYDAGGRLETVTAPSGVATTVSYRGLRPREVEVSAGGVSHTIRDLEFLPFGPRTSAALPPWGASGHRVTSRREYNLRLQATRIEVEATGTQAATLLEREYHYDDVADSPAPNDPGPNLDRIVDGVEPGESRLIFYDELDRLWKVSDPSANPLETYTYDAAGNRLSESVGGASAGYVYETSPQATNRLVSRTGAGPRHYRHDAFGNRVFDSALAWAGTPSLVYDDSNRLVEVRDPAAGYAVVAQYGYDGFGRRVRKVLANTSRLYFYDPSGEMIEEIAPNAPPTLDLARRRVFVEGELLGVVYHAAEMGALAWVPSLGFDRAFRTRAPVAVVLLVVGGGALFLLVPARGRRAAAVAMVGGFVFAGLSCTSNSEFFWVHTDPLGTPLLVTNTVAETSPVGVVWKARYEGFGKATLTHPTTTGYGNLVLDTRFPGQIFDAETGYHYNFYRTYDPATGSYLEADPLGQAGGLNLFAYVESDPINNIDPEGLQAVSMGVALPSAAAAAAVAPLPIPFPIPIPNIPAPPPLVWIGVAGGAGYWVGTQIEPYVSPIIWPYIEKLADECDDGPDCEESFASDVARCRGIGRRSKARAPACYESAVKRYAACRAGDPPSSWPPLITWNN